MDPATAIQIAGTALAAAKHSWEASTALYNFFRNAKKFDKTAEAFVGEVKALGTACEAVNTTLNRIMSDRQGHVPASSLLPISKELRDCLDDQVDACQMTVSSLKEAVRVTEASEGLSYFEKAMKQIKLNLRAHDVAEARNRVRSHTASLQVVLSSIGIEISYISPKRADAQLQKELLDLELRNAELTELLARVQTDGGQENHAAILEASKQVISDGASLFGDPTIAETLRRDDSDMLKTASIEGWLKHATLLEGHNSRHSNLAESEADSVFSATRRSACSHTDYTNSALDHALLQRERIGTAPLGKDGYLVDVEDDEDDDYRVDITRQTITVGRETFQKQDYCEAAELLNEALKMRLELSIEQQRVCDITDFGYMLAVCGFYLKDAASAKSDLLRVIEDSTSMTKDESRAIQICEIGHLLAQTCVKLGDLEEARSTCESTIHSRRRLLGKKSEAYYDSLALMTAITKLQGNLTRSKVLMSSIPTQHSEAVDGFVKLSLDPPKELPGATIIKPLADVKLPFDTNHRNSTAPPARIVPNHNPNTTEKEMRHTYTNTHIKAWAEEHHYRPYTFEGVQNRQKAIEDRKMMPISDLSMALFEGRDDDALKLVGKSQKLGTWQECHDAASLPDLHIAAWFGATEVVEALLQVGADVDRISDSKMLYGETALHWASSGGCTTTISLLLEAGSAIEARKITPGREIGLGATPLSWAVGRFQLDAVDVLLRHGADPLADCRLYGSPLHRACADNKLVLLKALSTSSADFSVLKGVTLSDEGPRFPRSAFDGTTFKGDHEITPRLRYASIDSFGLAAYRGHSELVRYFIGQGVNATAEYKTYTHVPWAGYPFNVELKSCSALALAAAVGNTATVELLLTVNLGVEVKDLALSVAVLNKHDDLACLIFEHGATIYPAVRKFVKHNDMPKMRAKIEAADTAERLARKPKHQPKNPLKWKSGRSPSGAS